MGDKTIENDYDVLDGGEDSDSGLTNDSVGGIYYPFILDRVPRKCHVYNPFTLDRVASKYHVCNPFIAEGTPYKDRRGE